MNFLINVGPATIAIVVAIIMSVYLWNRSKQISSFFLIWITIATFISQIHIFLGFPQWLSHDWLGFTLFGFLTFTPAALLLFFTFKRNQVKIVIDGIPTADIILTQSYRIAGIFLLFAFVRGELPLEIGLMTGILDCVVAFSAVMIGAYLRYTKKNNSRIILPWAILGLLDFGWAILALTLSFLGLWNLTPAPVMMGNPPLLIISLFNLPLGIFVSVYLILRTLKHIINTRQKGE